MVAAPTTMAAPRAGRATVRFTTAADTRLTVPGGYPLAPYILCSLNPSS